MVTNRYTATPIMIPAPISPRAKPRAIRRPSTASRARTASWTATPSRKSSRPTELYRAARCSSEAEKYAEASSRGWCKSAGTCVRQSSVAATSQAATARTIVAPLSKRVAVISDVHGNRHALDAVLDAEAAWWTLNATSQPLVLVGHSHVPLAIELEGDELGGGLARGGSRAPARGPSRPGRQQSRPAPGRATFWRRAARGRRSSAR